MNVYDEAHNLERAIKESEEYKRMAEAKAKMNQNPQLKSMMEDFQKQQMELQTKQMMGQEIGEEEMKKIQEVTAIVMQDPTAADYLQCEMRFALMMQDVAKILSDVMGIPDEA